MNNILKNDSSTYKVEFNSDTKLAIFPDMVDSKFSLSIEDENLVLSKLKTEKRSAAFILKNENLCKRILNEVPISISEFCTKYNYQKNSVLKLIDNNIISSFSNSNERGKKLYVFENELLQYNNSHSVKNFSPLPLIIECVNIYLEIARESFTPNSYLILKNYFSGKTIEEQSKEFNLSNKRIDTILKLSLNRLKNIKARNEDSRRIFGDLLKESKDLSTGLLSMLEGDLSTNIQKENKVLYSDTQFFFKNNMPIRLLTVLNNNNIYCINDLLKHSKRDFQRFRGLGTDSYNKLLEFCKQFDLPLKNE